MAPRCRPGGDPKGHSPTPWGRRDQDVREHPVYLTKGLMIPLRTIEVADEGGRVSRQPVGDYPIEAYKPMAVLDGWLHGYHWLNEYVQAIEAGSPRPTLTPSIGGDACGWQVREWDDVDQFLFIVEHGFVRVYHRGCRQIGDRCSVPGIAWWETHRDPTDPRHPRASQF